MNKPKNTDYLSDIALDAISEVDKKELDLELEDIKKAVAGLPKEQQKQYKFLLK